jgi:hypothetical protein
MSGSVVHIYKCKDKYFMEDFIMIDSFLRDSSNNGNDAFSMDLPNLLTPIFDNNFENFEKYLTTRKNNPEKPYGIFDKDVSICRFFDSGNNDNILADIKKKNEEQGLGNIKIPNTNIMLINYSFCPKCNLIYSFKEVTDYYKNPRPDRRYEKIAHQFRNDTRVFCNNCNTYFLPSLVISDGTPKNEVQFLCRIQTINAVEKYMLTKNTKVLTKKKSNIVYKDRFRAIKNDISIKDLEEKPTLVTNLIQYTPYNLIMNFIDGTNADKGDVLYDEWKWIEVA